MAPHQSGQISAIRPDAYGYTSMTTFIVLGTLLFAMEVLAVVGFARFGWQLGDGAPSGLGLAILFPVIMFGIWATFRTKGDPTRKQAPLVAIPGWLRLILEWTYFALGFWALWETGARTWAAVLLIGVVLVNVFGWKRQRWLLQRR